jgi:hypothetical protein
VHWEPTTLIYLFIIIYFPSDGAARGSSRGRAQGEYGVCAPFRGGDAREWCESHAEVRVRRDVVRATVYVLCRGVAGDTWVREVCLGVQVTDAEPESEGPGADEQGSGHHHLHQSAAAGSSRPMSARPASARPVSAKRPPRSRSGSRTRVDGSGSGSGSGSRSGSRLGGSDPRGDDHLHGERDDDYELDIAVDDDDDDDDDEVDRQLDRAAGHHDPDAEPTMPPLGEIAPNERPGRPENAAAVASRLNALASAVSHGTLSAADCEARVSEIVSLGGNLGARFRDRSGRTLLHLAAGSRNVPLTRALLDNLAPTTHPDGSGALPIHHCAATGARETAILVIAAAPDGHVNAAALTSQWTPLHFACHFGRPRFGVKKKPKLFFFFFFLALSLD